MKTVKVYENGKLVKRKQRTKQNLIEVEVPALVPNDVWLQVQKMLDHNREKGRGRKTNYEYLMAKRLTCLCEYKMKLNTKNKGQFQYYMCPQYSIGKPCVKLIRHHLVDDLAWEWLKNLILDRETFKTKVEDYYREQEQILAPKKERLAALETSLSKDTARYEKLLDLYLGSEKLSKEMLEGRKAELEAKIKEKQSDINDLKRYIKLQSYVPTYREMQAWLSYMDEKQEEYTTELENADFTKKREYVRKYALRGTLLNKDGKEYLFVECLFDNDLLQLCDTS